MPHPPWTKEAEEATLGAILLCPKVSGEVMERLRALEALKADDFHDPRHRLIFRAMERLYETGKPIDLTSVGTHLKDHDQLDVAGGLVFLANLSENVGTAANVTYYARLVREKAVLRQYQEFGQELMWEAGKAGTSIKDLHQFLRFVDKSIPECSFRKEYSSKMICFTSDGNKLFL